MQKMPVYLIFRICALHWDERMCGNSVMAFPIKKRTNAALFIDRTAAFYFVETQIRVVTNEGINQ